MKTYECGICRQVFLAKYALKRHECGKAGQGYSSREKALETALQNRDWVEL